VPQTISQDLEFNPAALRRRNPRGEYYFEPTSPFGYVIIIFVELVFPVNSYNEGPTGKDWLFN
jgi:hypothetical protein